MEYTNNILCLNALAQSAGRLLRSPENRGIIVLMDGRSTERFKQKLPKDWTEYMKAHYNIEKILVRIKNSIFDSAQSSEKEIRI